MAKRITKSDLQKEVSRLNRKYCKNKKNHLVIDKNGFGYSVNLTGKQDKRFKRFRTRKGSLGTSQVRVSGYYSGTSREIKNRLLANEKDGSLRRIIRKRG